MTKAMREIPKGITREERSKLFCIEAKLCSGKAKNENDAAKLCANQVTKPKSSGKRGGLNAEVIAGCLLPKLSTVNTLTVNQLANWISQCSGQGGKKIKKPQTQNQFIKRCALEQGVNELSIADAIKVRKTCLAQWKEKQTEVASV
jgi:hypothetical protein